MQFFPFLGLLLTTGLTALQPRIAWADPAGSLPAALTQQTLPMLINYGVGGSWVNPQASSQGLVIEVIPELNTLTAYWFTFGPDGDRREWYIAVGDIEGDTVSLAVYRVEGGIFEQVTMTDEVLWGSAVLNFSSCTTARFEFNSPLSGIAAAYDLVRLTPDVQCASAIPAAHSTFVTTGNRWLDGRGLWEFDTCVNLGPNESHGREVFYFGDATVSFDIDFYNAANCQGPVTVQSLSFDMVRVDKTLAVLEGTQVIANRVLLEDLATGQVVRQIFYFDDSQDNPRMTHGVMDGPVDDESFPNTLHSIFAKPLSD